MNKRMIARILGKVLLIFAALMLLPLAAGRVKSRQKSPARLIASTFGTTDAPVVVRPDTVSNTASM